MNAIIDPGWRSAAERVAELADQPEGGVHVVTVPGGPAGGFREAMCQELERRGYVPVDAGAGRSADLPVALRHRHVALWCGSDESRGWSVRWVRALAQASPRRHLVMCVENASEPAAAVRVDLAREKVAPPAGHSAARQLAGAERWQRRGRPRAALAWMRGAIAASARHGDAPGAARLAIGVAAGLCHRGEWAEAERCLREVLRPAELDWILYGEASALLLDTMLGRGALDRARDWATAVTAEAALRREPWPADMRTRAAELAFWLGACPPGLALVGPGPASAGEAGWLAMSAWSRGQFATVATTAAQMCTRWRGRDPHAPVWASLLAALLGGRNETREEVGGAKVQLPARWADDPQVPVRLRALARAIGVRASLLGGRTDLLPGPRRACEAGDPSDRLCAALQAKHGAAAGVSTAAFPDARGWLGFQSLLNGRADMYLVDGVTGLLQVMEDAEDELSALAGGCQWVRKHAGAAAVGIVSADQTRLIAAQGWKPTDLSAEIGQILSGPARDARSAGADREAAGFGVPIRYGGVTLGHVVARGRSADRPVVQEAAQALAAVSGSALCARLDMLALQDRERDAVPEILGRSPLIMDLRQSIARAAATSFPVLIEGESGTGKELVARALHRLSARRDHRFQAVNCAALSDELVEAELFGHARGAFTGAVGPRAGLFEEAHGGTLFLDEVSELSPRAQAKLLRVLQEREVRRVGENNARRVDVRPIAATNLPLAAAVAGGRFRDDLRFRLAVVRIRLPPLRDRPDDLPLLAQVFWRRVLTETGKRAVLGPDALARMARHHWPGNVRELQNVIAGLAVGGPVRGRVTARHVSEILAHAAAGEDGSPTPPLQLDAARRLFEQRLVAAALARHAGRRTAAARDLGLTRQGLTKAIRRLGLSAPADLDDMNEAAAGVA